MNREELITLSLQFSGKEKEYEELKKLPEQDTLEYWKKRSQDVEAILQHMFALGEKFNDKFPSDGTDSFKLDERKNRRRVKSIEIGSIDSTQLRVAEVASERSHAPPPKLVESASSSKGSRTSRERSVSSSPNPLRSSSPSTSITSSSGSASVRQRAAQASTKQPGKYATVSFNDCLRQSQDAKEKADEKPEPNEKPGKPKEDSEVSGASSDRLSANGDEKDGSERSDRSDDRPKISSKPSAKLTRSDGGTDAGLSETQKSKERKPRDRSNLNKGGSDGAKDGDPSNNHNMLILEILLPNSNPVPSVQEPTVGSSSNAPNSTTSSGSSGTGALPSGRTKKRSVSAAPQTGAEQETRDRERDESSATNTTAPSSTTRSERGASKSPERGGGLTAREERPKANVRRLSEDFTKQLRLDEKGADLKPSAIDADTQVRVKKEVTHPSALQIFQNLEIESEIMKVKEANKIPTSARGRSRSFNDNSALISSSSKPQVGKFGPDLDGTSNKRERPKGGLFEKPVHNTVGKNKFHKKPAQSRMNLLDIVRSDGTLSPVVLPVESNAFLIEVPEFCSDPELNLLYIPDHYKEIFSGNKHFNWIACTESQIISIVSLLEKCDENTKTTKGLINNKKVFELPPSTESEKAFDFTSLQHNIRAIQLEKALKAQNPKTFYSRIKGADAENAIANIEKQFRQEQSIFKVSIVYCKAGQVDPLQMFKNVEHSESFDQFLNIMEVSSVGTNCLDELITWKEKKVGYLLATKLNAEQHRRLIGNTQAVIFFKESNEPFNTIEVDKMGIVPQFFAVVQPANDGQYRIGFFNRIAMKIIEPKVPSNILFDKKTLKDFLLTKIHNGYMIARQVPPINRLWEQPRQVAINQIAYEYAPKQWLKKVAPQIHDEIEVQESLLG